MNRKRLTHLIQSFLTAACLLAASTRQAEASSYASNLSNNNGTVSFRLNDAADNVTIKANNGALSIDLGPLPAGVTTRDLSGQGLGAGNFDVVVFKVGSGAPSLIGPERNYNSPRGVTVNVNPASPYFGRVYVANSAAGTPGGVARGDGIYMLESDLTEINASALTGGLNFATGGTSAPYRIKAGRNDDRLYIADWSDSTGNLYVTTPEVTDGAPALKPFTLEGGATSIVPPVGAGNNHGSVAAAEVLGTLAAGNLQVFTVDEDYQVDPTQSTSTQRNSLWQYNVNAGPLPWENPPDAKLATPVIASVSQTMDLSYSPATGYFYMSQLRTDGLQPGVYVIDPLTASIVWESRTASLALVGGNADLLRNLQGVTASPDGRFLATINNNNVVTIVPMVDGLPDLERRVTFSGLATTASARGISFDAANNLYLVSSGIARLRALSLGFTALATTKSTGEFTLEIPDTDVNVQLIDPTTLSEADTGVIGQIRLNRVTGNIANAVSVNFTVAGSATRGTAAEGDYFLRVNGAVITGNSVTIPANADHVLIDLVVNNDSEAELSETVIFTLAGGLYNAVAPLTGTLTILDNEPAVVNISALNFTQMYEVNEFDRIRLTVERRGDLSAAAFDVNLAYAGTATSGVDYTPVATVSFAPDQVTQTVDILPLNDTSVEGPETVIVSVASGAGYTAGTGPLTGGATGTIRDDDLPTETVLFADNFNEDTSAQWTALYGSVAPEVLDYRAEFAFDYSTLVPPAPNSTSDTFGLLVTVNKLDQVAQAAGINLYPNGQNFSGNFALRFDMYLMQNGSAATTEHVIFGINHDGTKTNWFRSSGNGVPAGWFFDGLWAAVIADASDLGDYLLHSAPGVGATFYGPSVLQSKRAADFADVFHRPPWSPGSGPGSPGNTPASNTKSWAQVELSQVDNVVTLKINNAVIYSHNNTAGPTSGNIMIGYNDAFDSIGTGGGGLVIYDNLRVVRLEAPLQDINVSITQSAGSITLTWTGNAQRYLVEKKVSLNDATWMPVATTSANSITLPKDGAAGFFRVAAVTDPGFADVVPMTAYLNGAAERPTAVNSPATGVGTVSIQGNTLHYTLSYQGFTQVPSNAHIHSSADSQAAGSVLVGISVPQNQNGMVRGTITLTDPQRDTILAGRAYFNIHTPANSGGEIRGQITRTRYIARFMNGASERPDPVPTLGAATTWINIVGNELHYDVSWVGLSSDATAGHIHGRAGVEGFAGVLQGIPGITQGSGRSIGVVTMTGATAANTLGAIVDGQAYVNIHTTFYPSGEVRGQLTPDP